MCGICGIFSFSGATIDGAGDRIAAMNEKQKHRGPDDSGYWHNTDGRVHFGHRRLSIIDLSPAGHQPMVSAKGNAIVFNGEIYNYRELKDKFLGGEGLHSASDTEVLLLLYEKLGPSFLDHINGMFAFAIWDAQQENLFVARDPSGKKPFYYTVQNGVFAFSSELKALLELPWVNRELDEEALYHFLTFNLLPPPFTMFSNIRKMRPAHTMVVDREGIKSYHPYWFPAYQDLSSSDETALTKKILEGLKSSVGLRMVSDVPVGAFLSGGVDSSAVVALISQLSPKPVKTYSIGFKEQPDYSELRFAESISKKFGTNHYEKIISSRDIVDFLPHVVDVFDEPMADATCIPIYFISQAARENGSVVVLTGDGSDELFGGYRNWIRYLKYYPLFRMMHAIPSFLRRINATLYSLYDDDSPVYEMLWRAAHDQEFFWGSARSFKESTKRKFLGPEFNTRIGDLDSSTIIRGYRRCFEEVTGGSRNRDYTDWMSYLGFSFSIPEYYLYRLDRLGMSQSIEIRAPFLDRNLVSLALSLEGRWKIHKGEPKYILKKSLEGLLPNEILYRKKRGFNVPLREWAGGMMISYIEENLRSFCNDHPQFSYRGLHYQLARLKKGDKKVTNKIWTIYFLMAWFKKWMP